MEQMPQFPVNCMGQVYVWLNVVSGPWNIPSTQAVLSLASTKRYLQAIYKAVYYDKFASVLWQIYELKSIIITTIYNKS